MNLFFFLIGVLSINRVSTQFVLDLSVGITVLENDAQFECDYSSLIQYGISNIKSVEFFKINTLIHLKNATGDFSFGDYVGRIKPVIINNDTSMITLEKAIFSDNGLFRCKVETLLNGTQTATVNLDVKYVGKDGNTINFLDKTITSSSCATIDVELSKAIAVSCISPQTIDETVIIWTSNSTVQTFSKKTDAQPLEIDKYNTTNGIITTAEKTITITKRNEIVDVTCNFKLPDNTTKTTCVKLRGDPLDECSTSRCKNGATCVDQFKNFTCQCPSCYGGRTCEIDLIDECVNNSCPASSTCENLCNDFKCNCHANLKGPNCNIPCGNIKSIDSDTRVLYGTKLDLTCIKNSTDGTYSWQDSTKKELGTNSVYSIQANFLKEKYYYCNVKTDECLSRTHVKVSTYYILFPNETETNTAEKQIGDKIELKCSGSGSPTPLLFWRFTVLTKSAGGENATTAKPNTPKIITNETINSTYYVIDKVTKADFGKYECVAKIAGSIEVIKILTLKEAASSSDDDLEWWVILLIVLGIVLVVAIIVVVITVLCIKGVCPECCTCCKLPSICPAEKSVEVVNKRDPAHEPMKRPIIKTETINEQEERDNDDGLTSAGKGYSDLPATYTKPGALPPLPTTNTEKKKRRKKKKPKDTAEEDEGEPKYNSD